MIRCDVLIAGGGPAGMMAGMLFARAGLQTVVLEKHGDFLRDFRGDTVHPSTMEIFHQIGMLEAFLKRPHERMDRIGVRWRGQRLEIADMRRLRVQAPFIAFMPQWEFLDFIATQARLLPAFTLLMSTEATEILEEGGAITGVRAKSADGDIAIRARLTIAADGRSSRLRQQSGLPLQKLGAPVDVLWFSLPRDSVRHSEDSLINAAPGTVAITIDRGTYWQCAFVIPKGGLDALKVEGIERFRSRLAEAAPHLHDAIPALTGWDDMHLLSVAVDRLQHWSRPGFLAIGDAAHAMSPVGGVGINLAIQDAVAAANLLAPIMRKGHVTPYDLVRVQERRMLPTRATQFVQVQIQNRLLAPLIAGGVEAPLPLRMASRVAPMRRVLARAVGMGVRTESVSQYLRRSGT